MATSRVIFDADSAKYPATNFPAYMTVNRQAVLAYDAGTNETAFWESVAPQGLAGALTAVIYYMMASATTGDTDWDVSVEAVTPGDATDLDAGDSFDTINSTDNTTVPATAGYRNAISVTLTNADSIAAGDRFRVRVTRDAASDTATGDAYVLHVEIREA